MTTSASAPILASTRRPAGIPAQPASWPWVTMTTRRTPASRIRGASSPSGAAAPKTTVSHPNSATSPAARRATAGVGSISEVGCRTTGYGWRRSKAALPTHRGA
ncbi:hypothetical protein GCM10018952_67800 [Streptosporangium vulgare]